MAAIAPRTHLAHFPAAVKNVLVIVSELQDARATASILAAIHARESVRLHLLALETPPSGYARSFLGGVDFHKVQRDSGLTTLAPLRAELDAARIPYRFHVEIGPWLATIARYSRDIDCVRIVVGDNPGSIVRKLALRHDCWRIKSFLRRSGRDCAVVQRGEGARHPPADLSRKASHPN